MKIIGLSGLMGSGKDFIYEQYLYPYGYRKFALADHFKIWAIGRGLATYDEVFYTKPPHVRDLLQQEGTERGRMVYGEDIWVNTALAWMTHLSNTLDIHKWCCADVRFPNELAFIQNSGGKVFRVVAPDRCSKRVATDEAKQHASETSLSDFMIFDGYIQNDESDQYKLKSSINLLLSTYQLI